MAVRVVLVAVETSLQRAHLSAGTVCPRFFFFSSSSVLLSSLELSDTQVYEPQIRARLGTTARSREPTSLLAQDAPASSSFLTDWLADWLTDCLAY